MRLATRWLLLSILTGASATSLPASFFAFESPNSLSDDPRTVNPEVSRLILAKRLGLSQFHRLKGLDDDTLRQVDHFGGGQQPLLRDAGDGRRESSMVIIVEGVENTSGELTVLRGIAAPARVGYLWRRKGAGLTLCTNRCYPIVTNDTFIFHLRSSQFLSKPAASE
jgi:hypothetical protein